MEVKVAFVWGPFKEVFCTIWLRRRSILSSFSGGRKSIVGTFAFLILPFFLFLKRNLALNPVQPYKITNPTIFFTLYL